MKRKIFLIILKRNLPKDTLVGILVNYITLAIDNYRSKVTTVTELKRYRQLNKPKLNCQLIFQY